MYSSHENYVRNDGLKREKFIVTYNDANVLVNSATSHSVGIVFVLSFKPTNVKLLINLVFKTIYF